MGSSGKSGARAVAGKLHKKGGTAPFSEYSPIDLRGNTGRGTGNWGQEKLYRSIINLEGEGYPAAKQDGAILARMAHKK